MILKIDNININYVVKGSGKDLLLLEGWNTNINVYKRLINHLSSYRKVYALDLPGFGDSDDPPSDWNLDNFIDLVNKFILKFNLHNFDIIAHSFGGRIVIKGLSNNININKIILISPAGIKNKVSLIKNIRYKIYKIIKTNPILKNKYIQKYASNDYKNASLTMRKILVRVVNEDLTKYLPKISKSCLLLWGENDKQVSISNGMKMNKMIKDSGLCIIPNSAHFCFLENEYYTYKVIDSFLEGNEK